MVRKRYGLVSGGLSSESGDAMLEAALVIPVILLLVFGIAMMGRVVQAEIAVQAAVREAGRVLATAPSASEGIADARASAISVASGYGLSAERLNLVIDAGTFDRGGTVRTVATYPVALDDLPLLGQVQVTVSGDHVERIERYRSRSTVAP